jgi:hypothetical protein
MIADFLMGAVAMGFLVASLFFLSYWRATRQQVFGFFTLAFFLLAADRLLLVVLPQRPETSLAPYLVRLLAFGIVLGAILDKHLRST